jgi:ankyrin repeat protein
VFATPNILQLLLQHKELDHASHDIHGQTVLQQAAQDDTIVIIEKLLHADRLLEDVEIDSVDCFGKTAAGYAAQRGDGKIIEI